MPRRHRSTVLSMCVPSLSVDHALVNDVVALLGALRLAVPFSTNYCNRDRGLAPQGEIEARRQRTETTTFRTSEGIPETSSTVIGLPFTGIRNNWARISKNLSRKVRRLPNTK